MLETEKIKKNLVFLKQQYWHNSPKTLRLLVWRVKQQKSENAMHTIKTPSGNLVGRTLDILKEFERYYMELHQSTCPNKEDQDNFFESKALFQ